MKDIKLYTIRSLETANAYLEPKFLLHINHKFAKQPSEDKLHRDKSNNGGLDENIFWHYRRKRINDWTIQFKREYYQIRKKGEVKSATIFTLKKYLDGKLRLWQGDKNLKFPLLQRKPIPPYKLKQYYVPKEKVDSNARSRIATKNKHKSP